MNCCLYNSPKDVTNEIAFIGPALIPVSRVRQVKALMRMCQADEYMGKDTEAKECQYSRETTNHHHTPSASPSSSLCMQTARRLLPSLSKQVRLIALKRVTALGLTLASFTNVATQGCCGPN